MFGVIICKHTTTSTVVRDSVNGHNEGSPQSVLLNIHIFALILAYILVLCLPNSLTDPG